MELEKFVRDFAEQFDEISTIDFDGKTMFKENDEWSSMTALSIIAMVDDIYEIRLTGDDIRSSVTIEDIYEKVVAKIKG